MYTKILKHEFNSCVKCTIWIWQVLVEDYSRRNDGEYRASGRWFRKGLEALFIKVEGQHTRDVLSRTLWLQEARNDRAQPCY